MTASKLGFAVFAALGLLIAAVPAVAANAAPYSRQPTLSVSTTTPAVHATITVSGADWAANETVALTLHTETFSLGTATANGSGGFSTSVTLPSGVSGTHTLVGTGSTGDTASVTLNIGGAGNGGGGGGGGGGLSSTGVAVIGTGVVGIALLGGGILMLLAGRRRNARV